MSTLDHAQTAPPANAVRMITSINELPYYCSDDQAYVVSGAAMKQITEELQRLWALRQMLADLVQTEERKRHRRAGTRSG